MGSEMCIRDSLYTVKKAAESGRQQIMNFADDLGLHAVPSSTNFVAVDLESTERAKAMIAKLADLDVFMRMPGVAPLNRCVRVGLGSAEEFDLFASAFKQAL